MEDLEAKIIERVKQDYKKSGGWNGTELKAIDDILGLSIEERNAFLDRMVKEKKIAYLRPLNGPRITMPK